MDLSLYRVLFENSAQAMLVLENNVFVACNRAAMDLLKVDRKSKVRRLHPASLSPPVQPDGVMSEVKAEHMITLACERGRHTFEWVHRNANGLDFTVEVELTTLEYRSRKLILVRWRDLAERDEAYKQLQFCRALFQGVTDAVVVADENNRIVDVNAAFTSLTGYERIEALGQPSGFMKSGRHPKPFYQRMWHMLNQDGGWEGEVWDRHKNGHVYPKSLKINVIRNLQGDIRHYIAIFRDSSQQKEHERKLQELAYYDPLTKLANRRLLMERLEQRLLANDRDHSRTALLSIDVDEFKSVNDTYGHPVGDELLVEIARRLSSVIRACDTLGRMSGDEFLVISDVSRHEDDIAVLAEKLVAEIERPFHISGKQLGSSLSIGIAFYPRDADSSSELISHADMAMYQAKRQKEGSYCFYDQSIGDYHHLKLDLAKGMKEAILSESFTAYFQPIVNLSNHSVYAYEALARWFDPERGSVNPEEFILLAEETGMIQSLSEQVFRRCCEFLRHMGDAAEFKLALNLSAQQLKSRTLVEWLKGLSEEQGVSLSRFKVELTESTLISSLDLVTHNLRALKALGVDIVLDDFGTGYSSLTHLKSFPIDCIKIDKSFVRDLTECQTSDNYLIVKAIIKMAQSLRLRVVAEGVETESQLDLLQRLGCDQAQGYFFSRPKPWEECIG